MYTLIRGIMYTRKDLVGFEASGDGLQKQLIDRIKSLEDSHTAAAGRYYAWLDKTGYGFVDGLEPYLAYLRANYQSARTISAYFFGAKNRVRMLMPSFKAEERGQLQEYLQRLNPDKSERSIDADKILSGEEIKRLLDALREGNLDVMGCDVLAYAVEFLQASAARISEMLAARWTDVVETGSEVRIRIHGKGHKERTIPFVETSGDLLARLRRHFQGTTWIFEHDKKKYTRGYISAGLRHAGKHVLARDISAHTFRHSTLTRMIEKGIAIKKVSRFAGHSSTAITQDLYVHLAMKHEDLSGLWDEGKNNGDL
ncbi:Tyrosine recombinase XerC [subsurface metagenome]